MLVIVFFFSLMGEQQTKKKHSQHKENIVTYNNILL